MSLLDLIALERAPGESDGSLADRQGARDMLASQKMPTGREEVWRYVDLDFELADFKLATAPDPRELQPEPFDEATAATARIADGAVVASDATAAGVTCDRRVGVTESIIDPGQDIFTTAHAAYGADTLLVTVAERTAVAAPVLVDVVATDAAASFPGVRVEVADGAELTVVVRLRSGDDVEALVVPHVEGVIGANANLTLVIDQGWGAVTRSIGQAAFNVGADSSLRLAEAGLGGALARWQLDIKLAGRGSNAQVIGAYFGDSEQTLDYRYVMHHAAPNTHSEMFLKGAVQDEASSVFTGMIRIDEIAQRTDAFQTNRNLILSDGASAQSVPNLEILANDVKCGHGSTVGQLDEEQRYYLMSRGLDERSADRLQVRGFFEEAINRIPVAAVGESLSERFTRKFVEAQREGRV